LFQGCFVKRFIWEVKDILLSDGRDK
jgi:hypothetical protein